MALNNFASLSAEMKDWALDRPDLVPKFQDCINMAINDVNAVLRMPQQQAVVMLTPDDNGVCELPDDYLEVRRVTWFGNPQTVLKPLTPEGNIDVYPNTYGGTPVTYMITDGSMWIQPLTTDAIELMYWAKVPQITTAAPNDTNWLLQVNPNVILFGAMKYVEVYKRNQNGMQTFGQLYSAEIDGLVRTGKRSQWGRTRARVAGRSTP
jgi:hypothetical protein